MAREAAMNLNPLSECTGFHARSLGALESVVHLNPAGSNTRAVPSTSFCSCRRQRASKIHRYGLFVLACMQPQGLVPYGVR